MSETGPVASADLLVQDGTVELGDAEGAPLSKTETKKLRLSSDANDRFLDGPACRRLAVVDFDPETGAPLPPPAAFVANRSGSGLNGSFPGDETADGAAALAINAFGTAFLTIRMFEGDDALGRTVKWAFGGEQLLVVPRAGRRANAYYDRSTRSLQFFRFAGRSGDVVHTALSRDIVAHECGHALLDAVVPSLYDRKTRDSVAIHEAVADVVALLMALDSGRLRTSVLARSGNRIDGDTAFSAIAEEFGMAKPGRDGIEPRPLRQLADTRTLAEFAGKDPHELSVVLSSIFYDTLRAIFEARFLSELEPERADGGRALTPEQAANRALGTAHLIFRRFVLRGIDYLPPGDLTFADVGRAMLAADRAIGADDEVTVEVRRRRERFAAQFVERGIVDASERLDGLAPRSLDVSPDELEGLRDRDFRAYEWVGRHRGELGIPDDAPFTVMPRVDATKQVGPRKTTPPQRELLVKVAWDRVADVSPGARRLAPVRAGAVVSLRWDDGRCLALVTSEAADRAEAAGADAGGAPGAAESPAGELDLDVAEVPSSRASADPGVFTPVPGRGLAAPPPGVDPGAFFDLVRARSRTAGR